MKNLTRWMLLLALASTMIFVLAACGGSGAAEEKEATLESYFEEHPDEKDEFLNAMVTSDDTIESKGEVKENTVVVTCKFKETYDQQIVDLMVPTFEDQADSLKEQITPMKDELANETEIEAEKIQIQFIYLNGDDKEIWQITI